MNYDHINKLHREMERIVYPNVQVLWNCGPTDQTLLGRYLWEMRKNMDVIRLNAPFLVDTEQFLKQYKKQCITFFSVDTPDKGAMSFIHQLAPDIHLYSILWMWMENEEVNSYIQSILFHWNYKAALQTMKQLSKLAKTGNTESKSIGLHNCK